VNKSPKRRRPAAPARRSWFQLDASSEVGPREDRVLSILAWVLAGLLAVALLYMVLGPHKVGDNFTETDFYGAYADGAHLIQQGKLVPSRYTVIGPVYEIVLGLVGFVIRDLFLAAELISLVSTLAILLVWFQLLRARLDARVGIIALLFLVTNGVFFQHGYGAMTDALAIALQSATLLLLLTRSTDRSMIGAGLFAGLAFLTRYNAVYLVPTGVVTLLAGAGMVQHRRRACLLFVAGFLAPVVPWVIYSIAHGSAFSFQLHHNIAYDVFARARGIPWDDYQRDLQPQFKTLWDVISRDPGAVARRLLFNVWDHLRQDALQLMTLPVAIAALAGLVLGIVDGSLRRVWPLALGGVLLFGTLVPVFYSPRYSLALLPLYATLAAIAFASPRMALVLGRGRRIWLKPLLAIVPLVLATRHSIAHQAHVLDQLPIEVLQCAGTLRRLGSPSDRVIARKWHIAYHGGMRALPFPFARTLPELADYAKETQARWLYFSWPEAETRPQFAYMLDTTAVVPGLTIRDVTRPHPAVLYEIGPRFGEIPDWFANDTVVTWHNLYAQLHIDETPKQLYDFATVSWMLGRFVYARNALQRAVQLDPGYAEAWMLLGNVLVMQNDAKTARNVYRRAQMLSPSDPAAAYGLGWASVLLGEHEEAARLWRPLIPRIRNRAALQRMVALFHAMGDADAEAQATAALGRMSNP
jgi:hypothetical protein